MLTPACIQLIEQEHMSVKAVFVRGQKLSADRHYNLELRGSDGTTRTNIVYVHEIKHPVNPQDESDVDVVLVSQYLPLNHFFPDAHPRALLLVYSNRNTRSFVEDAVHFRVSDIVAVHSTVSVHVSARDEDVTKGEGDYFSQWAIQRSSASSYDMTYVPIEPPHGKLVQGATEINFIDILGGAGGASSGFMDLGFSLKFGVEPTQTLAHSYEVCETLPFPWIWS